MTTPAEERLRRALINADKRREFIRQCDGHFYFVPLACSPTGGFSAPILRAIADELDRRNTGMTKEVSREYAKRHI